MSFILTHAKANSVFHPSGVGKWVPASAGKAKAGMVHSVCGWTRGVQVKLWDPLRTHAIPEHLRGVITTGRYTNPRLPLPLPQCAVRKAMLFWIRWIMVWASRSANVFCTNSRSFVLTVPATTTRLLKQSSRLIKSCNNKHHPLKSRPCQTMISNTPSELGEHLNTVKQ